MKRLIVLMFLLVVVFTGTSQGLNIAVSGGGGSQAGNQPIIDLFVQEFNATVTYGDFSNPANIPAGTDVFVVGRVLTSGSYSNAANSLTFNNLTIPVICFTSYVARPDSDRWGWHSGGTGTWHTLSGNETVVTAAGAKVFGVEGAVDWWNDASWGFSAPGTGTVGDGQILATSSAGDIVVAYWKAGDTSGTGAVFGSDRLLFNVPDQGSTNPADLPNTAEGRQALIAALKLIILQNHVPYDPVVLPLNPDGSVGAVLNTSQATVTLGWNAPVDPDSQRDYPVNPAVLGYYIYLSSGNPNDDPNVHLHGYVPQAYALDPYETDPYNEYGPLTLQRGVTYYWQVEGMVDDGEEGYLPGDPNNLMGPLWSFTVVPSTVTISSVSPGYNVVDAGANLTLSVLSAAADTYQWYKIGDPDAALENGDEYSGVDTSTLTIYDVQLADEGYYYCVVTNSLPSTASNRDTGPARVMTKRLMSHYPFETVYDAEGVSVTPDVVSGFDAALLSNDTGDDIPVLAAGMPDVDGDFALKFDNPRGTDPNSADAQYAQIDNGMAAAYRDITISAWVFSSGGSNWNRIVDFGNDNANYVFLCLNPGSVNNAVRFAVNVGGTEQSVTSPAQAVPVGEWTFITATLSGNTGRIYVNGERVGVNTSLSNDPLSFAPTTQNWLARSQWGAGDGYFNGLLDDLKIFNYGLSAQEVANEYLSVMTDTPWVCDREAWQADTLMYALDVNDDCRIDLTDFAAFAGKWLEDAYQLSLE